MAETVESTFPNHEQDHFQGPAQGVNDPLSIVNDELGPVPITSDIEETQEPNEPNQSEPTTKVDITDQVEFKTVVVADPNEAIPEAYEPAEIQSLTTLEPEGIPSVAPKKTVDKSVEPAPAQVEPEGPNPLALFYDEYAEILKEFVRPNGLVNYTPLRRKRLRLKYLLAIPDELDPNTYEAWSQDEKLAFWINTYNIKMLDVIARNYPIESSMWLRLTWPPDDTRHIKGIWSDYRFIVMDEEFTLGEVERRIFRQTFKDPRVYLALTYATRSSPPLRLKPYRGKNLDHQLDEQIKAFLANEQTFKIDALEGVVYLSALFKPSWRGKEFVARYGTDKKFKSYNPETRAVLNFLTQYLTPEQVHFLEVENYTLKYMNYDWRINDTSRGY